MTLILKSLVVVFAVCLLFSTVTACEKGPAEKAGEKIDKAVEETSDAVKDATN